MADDILDGIDLPEIVDDDAPDLDEVQLDSEDDAQPDRDATETDDDGDGDGDDGGTSDEEGQATPFRHVFKYKANGKEDEDFLEYDDQGNFTPETLAKIQKTWSFTKGLEARTQQAVEGAKRVERERDAERVRVQQWERKHQAYVDAWEPTVKFLKDNPDLVQALKARAKMPDLPDTEVLRIRMENEELRASVVQNDVARTLSDFRSELLQRHPDLTDDQLGAIGRQLQKDKSLERFEINEIMEPLVERAEGIIARMMISGEIKDPRIVKAEKQLGASKKREKDAIEIAKRRNPLAGAGVRNSKGLDDRIPTATEAFSDPKLMKKRIEMMQSAGMLD